MKILKRGKSYLSLTTEVTCKYCHSVLEINSGEWRKGDYGSEYIVKCAVCRNEIVKPGTEYQGDF